MDQGFTPRAIERIDRTGRTAGRDDVVVERPLELRCGDEPLAIVLRTPGDDLELGRGLMFAEGVVRDAAEAAAIARPPAGAMSDDRREDVVLVGLDPAEVAARWPRRNLVATAACGACGKASLAELEVRAAPITATTTVAAATLAGLPARLRVAQATFARTGGLHGAGLFDAAGALVVAREDIGRHNAVDKLVGWALERGLVPLADHVLVVSGRLGFEIAQKAVVAGLPIVVAVGAPSSLAIDLAERFRATLCGFATGDRLNVYSHGWRVA